MTGENEEHDPQDTAVLSDDMSEPTPEQETISVSSVYEGICRIAQTHGKLYRTNGKHADMLRFDLTTHTVWVGNAYVVSRGKLTMPVLETATTRVDLTGLPWLTVAEKDIDPQTLFRNHYLSRPNGAEKYMLSNFRAKDIDEMTDGEIAQGETRSDARVKLEAWILCAALDGTLESYVTSRPNWKPGNWWWSADQGSGKEPQLVIKTEWWHRGSRGEWSLSCMSPCVGGESLYVTHGNRKLAQVLQPADGVTARTLQSAMRSLTLAQSLADAALKVQLRTKCSELDPIITEVNRLVEYVRTGRNRTY